jgi:hypothetical protein
MAATTTKLPAPTSPTSNYPKSTLFSVNGTEYFRFIDRESGEPLEILTDPTAAPVRPATSYDPEFLHRYAHYSKVLTGQTSNSSAFQVS